MFILSKLVDKGSDSIIIEVALEMIKLMFQKAFGQLLILVKFLHNKGKGVLLIMEVPPELLHILLKLPNPLLISPPLLNPQLTLQQVHCIQPTNRLELLFEFEG